MWRHYSFSLQRKHLIFLKIIILDQKHFYFAHLFSKQIITLVQIWVEIKHSNLIKIHQNCFWKLINFNSSSTGHLAHPRKERPMAQRATAASSPATTRVRPIRLRRLAALCGPAASSRRTRPAGFPRTQAATWAWAGKVPARLGSFWPARSEPLRCNRRLSGRIGWAKPRPLPLPKP
jgi:hypothetical protein